MTGRPIHRTASLRADARAQLVRSAGLRPNSTVDTAEEARRQGGWRVDDRCRVLGVEPAGPPLAHGPFEEACRILERYEMADPAIIRAAFYDDAPLAGRDLLLEGRFLFLRFPMNVRVGEVVDLDRVVGGRPVHVWGWSYRTLEGHLEQGRMHWEVWKWLDTGRVEFRIHAFSRRGRIRNPIIRLGFALFGRATQERFYRAVLDRMARLVARRTGVAFDPAPVPCVGVAADERVTHGPSEAVTDPGDARSA